MENVTFTIKELELFIQLLEKEELVYGVENAVKIKQYKIDYLTQLSKLIDNQKRELEDEQLLSE